MNNTEYAISLILRVSPHSEDFNDRTDRDPISHIFAELALDLNEKNKNIELNTVLHHPRFSTACKLELFRKFFTDDNNNEQFFSKLLNENFFDLSTIFYSSNYFPVYFFDNKNITNLIITHLEKNKLYFPQILLYFHDFIEEDIEEEPESYKSIMQEELNVNNEQADLIFKYLKKCSKYSILDSLFINGIRYIDFKFNNFQKAFDKAFDNNCYFLNEKEKNTLLKNIHGIISPILNLSEDKSKHIINLILLSSGFCQIGILGENFINKEYVKGLYSETIFNSPYINLIDCIKVYNEVKKANLSEEEVNLIINKSRELNQLLSL